MGDSNGTLDFFEGTEKLLEVWFAVKPKGTNEDRQNLRKIPRKHLEDILDLVNCKILSATQNGSVDAYLLSESSMFVSRRRFILKTCGRTTLLNALEPLISLACAYCGFDRIQDVFYSRKNYIRPDLQRKPHSNFDEEVQYLEQLFENGSAFSMGRLNHDCWYLFTLDHKEDIADEPDQTLEVLMQELDPQVMEVFTQMKSKNAAEATKNSGISKIMSGVHIDDFLFEPCGYSMNGLTNNGEYATMHVTPEPHCSYVSFESNVALSSYNELISNLLACFKPGKFQVTMFANKVSAANAFFQKADCVSFNKYRRVDFQTTKLKSYELIYASFEHASFQ